MAEGLSETTANALLSAIFRGGSYSVSTLWAQKHVGPPGADGTGNVAADATRINVSAAFGTAPTGGQITNSATFGAVSSVPASEVYTHVSFWTASSGGTFVGSGTITSAPVTAGGPWGGVPVGGLTAAFPIAA